MSTKNTTSWLMSYKTKNFKNLKKIPGRTYSIAVTSGKGGVGKTSASIKISKELAASGYKVLLIDFDSNLSNTAVKMGLPINDHFYELINGQRSFDDSVYKLDNLHLLSACNGNLNFFESTISLDKVVIDIMVEHEKSYDFIILDCPAGLNKSTMSVCAYCDYRFVVVTPDKSSITDSYSLIKVLNNKFGVSENHVLLNKISSQKQLNRLVSCLSGTVNNFLNCRLRILGSLNLELLEVDSFDQVLLNTAGSKIHKSFIKIIKKFVEEDIGNTFTSNEADVNSYSDNSFRVIDSEQNVQLRS